MLNLAKDPACRVVCAGNSSSGIKETPAFGCPAVNIGSRQNGRLRADNVIDTSYNADEIVAAIEKSLYEDAYRRHCREVVNPYGRGDVGQKIRDVLLSVELSPRLLRKRMCTRGEVRNGWYR